MPAILNPCEHCVSQAAYSKLLMSTDENDFTATGGAVRLHFLGESISRYVQKRNDQGITGNLWKLADRFHTGQSFIWGPMAFAMNAGEMAHFLPYLVGSSSGTGGEAIYTPDDCPTAVHFLLQRDYGIWKYVKCYPAIFRVSSRSLRFQEESLADMVVLEITWLGSDMEFSNEESDWPSADEPELGSGPAFTPYFFSHSSLIVHEEGVDTDASQYTKEVNLAVDKKLEPRYRMSTSPTVICSGQRDVNLQVKLDWGPSTLALYEREDTPSGALRFSMDEDETNWTQFNFGGLVISDRDPASQNKDEDVEWEVQAESAAGDVDAGEYDISVTNRIAP